MRFKTVIIAWVNSVTCPATDDFYRYPYGQECVSGWSG